MADQVQQVFLIQHSLNQGFHLPDQWGCFYFSVRCFPGHEAGESCGDGTGFCFQAIGNYHKAVIGKQAGNCLLVGLELFECRPDSCVFIRRVFQFNDHERQAIDKENLIRPFIDIVFNNGELVGNDKVIIFRIFEINEPGKISPALAILLVADLYSLGQHPVECFIVAISSGELSL